MKKLKNKIKNNLKRKKNKFINNHTKKLYNKNHLKQYFIFKININKKSLKKNFIF